MNDLRQQQMVAATSSSGSESGTAVESAAATSTAGPAGVAGSTQSNCSANSNAKSVAASSTSEEEQRVSSTSSPAQRDQQLNADREREQDPEPQQQREEALQHQHNQPGHITSTTASPPPTLPPPTTPCDDAPSTTGASASASSASGEAPPAAEAAGGAMAATALEVESEERDGHKIILKLSKHVNPNSNANESQPSGDERRVEPLRIQLPCGGAEGGLVAKPQDAFDADASSCSSSCAEDEVATTLGQQLRNTPHIVPKLTIRAANERRVGSVVPKLTIKLPENPAASGSNSNSGSCSSAVSGAQSAMPAKNDAHLSSLSPASASSSSASSSSSSSSSSSLAEMQTVPKLMIKTTLAGSSCISSSEELPHQQQQIPKLTIKTGGGGQEHVHTVIMTHDLNNAQSIPKLTIKTKSIEVLDDEPAAKLEQQLQPLPKLTIKNLCSPKHKVRAVLEEKPPTAASKLAIPKPTPNPTPAPMTNGGESNSSSQEFCGFSDPDADMAAAASDEARRNSDDMVIDDSLSKEHDPKIFHNLPPMPASNGIASGGSKASKAGKPAQSQHNVVDMVDLTSSPSPGSSPTHVPNNFTGRISPKGLLLDCLRIQNAIGCYVNEEADSRVRAAASPNSNILLSQLTAPAKSFTTTTPKSKSSKYPQLTERLMANGSGSGGGSVVPAEDEAVVGPLPPANSAQSIIESIEILDTPDGSPRVNYMDEDPPPMLNKHLQTIHKLAMDLGEEQRMDTQDNNNENHLKRTISEGNESPNSRNPPSKQRRLDNDENDQQTQNCHDPARKCSESLQALPPSHRSRKQKHERILNTDLEGSLFPPTQQQAISTPDQNGALSSEVETEEAKAQDPLEPATPQLPPVATPAGTGKKRGRPKRIQNQNTAEGGVTAAVTPKPGTPQEEATSAVKSRRVQLLRKRLAIDMVSVGQEQTDMAAKASPVGEPNARVDDDLAGALETPKSRDHRPLRATRRTTTNTPSTNTNLQPTPKSTRKRQSKASVQQTQLPPPTMAQFGSAEAESNNNNSSISFALTAQIDLTMCSSSSSTSSGAAANQQVIGGSGSSSMLPPTTILSSSDPLPDVIFQPNDFSSIMATQQLRSPRPSSISGGSAGGSQPDSHDEDNYNSALDNSGDETTLPMLSIVTPTRGRGRGRGSRGGRGRGNSSVDRAASAGGTASTTPATQPRAPRMSRGASAVAKAIAMNRPRCVGGLKHQPDPERLKGLFSPSPQVFEEDTRMSADLSNSNQSMASLMEPPLTPQKQPDFLNNEESQSSMVSNVSMIDSNQGQSVDAILGSALKRPKKKKMEICVAEDTDYNASSIAEYDWPPPKGCCPSKNRDTFMIQEQVALYLGITSFKRKYPDLPRRAVDMEERNWLQEKGLVSEKLCDLGITAVWASDILDIMYADFYDKYEEYKEYIRQKHLREIEAKQKALGLTVGAGRGLQARDRAMLSASKWNVYFNKTRKDERLSCLDLQTFTMNQPQKRTAPTCTRLERSIAHLVRAVAEAANIPAPPTLLPPRVYDEAFRHSDYAYPLTVVPDQFSLGYRQFEPAELRAYPLDTALDKPSTDLMEQLLQGKSEAVDSEEIKTSASATKDLEQEQSAIKSESVTAPVRRSRRSTRQHTDKVRTASSSSTSSAQSVSSASSGNGSSSDTDSGDESDFSSSSSCSSSTGASSGAGSEDEDGNEFSSSTRLSNCGVCLRSQHRNARDMPEAFIRCYTCRKRVHPSCIDMPQRMVGRVRNYNWQCAGCKCCIKCRSSQRPGKMLYCEQCDRGYHIYCLGLRTVPDGRWSCERCCVCMRCGATKPEGLPQVAAVSQASGGPSPNGDRSKAARNKRLKWVHEYRIDHVTKVREHAAMFCVPCARTKPAKRQSTGAAGTATVPPVLETTSTRTDDSPMPSPGLTTNGGRSLSPTAALSPKAAVPVTSLAPVLEATAVATNIAGTIGRRQAANAVNITTMQCSTSFSGNGVPEDAATVTATSTATAAAGAPTATPIGIAPPPVVA
ncbi:supporter of activation of yellow protein [Drosophila santomea]|uniref:supporter of activation of yellow protein n=1 Tax=Drosophila santomea TaxID=129105 RepID=UPI001953F194|nr:supporter of activation of yellow protein [Drosophila santomea]XP_039496864.1 supporter of activation of yellow protein [Drosophila santomea]